jgi:hypothetical protein
VTTYPTEAAALARVTALRRTGCWPGIRHTPNGWQLLHDPDEDPGEQVTT